MLLFLQHFGQIVTVVRDSLIYCPVKTCGDWEISDHAQLVLCPGYCEGFEVGST